MPKYKVRSLKLSGLQLPGLDIISFLREYYSPTMTMRISVYNSGPTSSHFLSLITSYRTQKTLNNRFLKVKAISYSQFRHIGRCNDVGFDDF